MAYAACECRAQEMEPRAYSASPVGTNFLAASYTRTTGNIELDAALPISGVTGSVNAGVLGYEHTSDLWGRTASLALAIPYIDAGFRGAIHEAGTEIARTGIGDIRLRFAVNLVGGPALQPAEFALRTPSTALGVSLTVIAPTGDYNSAHLVNISSHRWAVKPEVGLSQPIGNWFGELALGGWFFTDNGEFLTNHQRGQEPMASIQVHGGYNFSPGLWLAADATRYFGGNTSLDGTAKHDFQSVTRLGMTLSIPIAEGWSAKAAWSTWLIGRNGGDYNTITLAIQYRWFSD